MKNLKYVPVGTLATYTDEKGVTHSVRTTGEVRRDAFSVKVVTVEDTVTKRVFAVTKDSLTF